MKKIFTILVIALSLKAGITQAQTIANSGFEQINTDGSPMNWGNVYLGLSWIDSSGISHSDSIVYDNAYYAPSNDAYAGTKALELRNAWNYTSNTGIAGAVASDDDSVFSAYGLFNLVPTNGTSFNPFAPVNFGFYYKYFPVNGDSAVARIGLWDSTGNQLAQSEIILSDAASSYTLVSAPVNYIAVGDAAFYTYTISNFYTATPGLRQPSFGTRLLVDNIGFNFATTSGIATNSMDDEMNVYPNPASSQITINTHFSKPVPYSVYNLFGQVVMEGQLKSPVNSLAIDQLADGVYYIKINTGNGMECRRFIVSKK
jgi:hypothetical protein